jgi:hypothetical protein
MNTGTKLVIGGVVIGGLLLWASAAKAQPVAPFVVPPEPDDPDDPFAPESPRKRPGGKPFGSPEPQGNDCNAGAYDKNFWSTAQRILDVFDTLGYATPTDRTTMNTLGPDGKLGGGDDGSNPEVVRFQQEYNSVSRWHKQSGEFFDGMGGLDEDGLVGPCTLNGLAFVLDHIDQPGNWPDVVTFAKADGF